MKTKTATTTIKQLRAIYNEHRKDCKLDRFEGYRDVYLMGVIDALRTAFNAARSPYNPPSDPESRSAYIAGFSCR